MAWAGYEGLWLYFLAPTVPRVIFTRTPGVKQQQIYEITCPECTASVVASLPIDSIACGQQKFAALVLVSGDQVHQQHPLCHVTTQQKEQTSSLEVLIP